MAVSRVEFVDRQFRDGVAAAGKSFKVIERDPGDSLFEGNPLTQAQAVDLLETQMTSRWIDFVARELKNEGTGFYTIGSSGHEGNAMVGQLTRHTDPAFLHYRSGGFFFARARQVPGETPIFDTCLSLAASREDVISGGRHKVWGSLSLNIPPQTSTIASQLPKAMGMAFFMDRSKAMHHPTGLPNDSIVVCSFGDASANHSTAVGAINAACWGAFQNLPVPVLFVCEDNGLGISVHTPENWIKANYQYRPGLIYVQADGLDMATGFGEVKRAVDLCRRRRRPVFLHLRTVRLMGHAGSDVETNYHDKSFIEATEAKDPLLRTATRLMEAGVLSPDDILKRYDAIAEQVRAAGLEAKTRPRHVSAATVTEPLMIDQKTLGTQQLPSVTEREHFWNGKLPENQRARHMAQLINWGLHDLLLSYPNTLIFGEDVAKKGGVYNVTTGLNKYFGSARVFNTLLDETSILGLAIGAGHAGLLPIPEIQYLAYLHNAIDQLRGEACSLKYFSEGRFVNPMVVRIAGFAYQRGFGGHFHNDNALAAIREIPGIVLVTASTGVDAVRLMRTCVDLAKTQGLVVVFVEPIALYMTKDLLEKGDYLQDYPPLEDRMPFGEVGFYGDPDAETLIISYANGTYLCRQAMADCQAQGQANYLLDLRFLTPLNKDALCEAASGRKHVLVVDECRQTGSLSEEIVTTLVETLGTACPTIHRICGEDTYIPLGMAWEYVLPSRETIFETLQRIHNG